MPTAEALARVEIDQLLTAAGWAVQNFKAGAGQCFTPRALIQAEVGAMASLSNAWGRREPVTRRLGA